MTVTNEQIVQMVRDKLGEKNALIREQEKRIAELEKELTSARKKIENSDNMLLTLEEILKNDA